MRIGSVLTTLLMTPTAMIAFPAIAEETVSPTAHQSEIMQKFAGTWKAEGTSFGLPSKSTMTWSKDLADKFYRVKYQIDMNREGKTVTFLGHGYYTNGSKDGFWADTGGELHPMVTSYSRNMLSTIWGKAGEKQGRSNYTLNDDGSVEVVDWILQKNGWREFNRTMFRRTD